MIENIITLCFFGAIGLGIEVIFTSLSKIMKKKDLNKVQLFGYSSIWYFPLYAIVLPLGIYLLQDSVSDYPLLMRGIIYAVLIHVGEFIAMWLLHLINSKSPSEKEYLASKHSIYGFTRWDYFPAFIFLGLLFEYLVTNWL